jgi:rhodanese-related sulfurtransferase
VTEERNRRPGLHARLAILALALAGLGVFAEPRPGPIVAVDTAELALDAASQVDSVAPPELADWILERRADFRLIDTRSEADYAEYHVPLAEHVPLPALSGDVLARNERIVLYGADEMRSAQAWLLLRARGHKAVYWLEGGLDGWKREVLFPQLPEEPAPGERERVARAREVSLHFGGQPRGGGASDADLSAAPMPEPPAASAAVSTPKKKKKGGC